MIAIIDYGMGNLGSILNMIRKVGGEGVVTKSSRIISEADKLILPGVGHFDSGIANLLQSDYFGTLQQQVLSNMKPVLGICLGMQLMTRNSQEGTKNGLGWLNAEVSKFNFPTNALKVPHMGWNTISMKKKNPLFLNYAEEIRFYFVHSYYVKCHDTSDVLATTYYGNDFVCAFQKNNIFGVQFHPEKSHRFGMNFFRRFLEL